MSRVANRIINALSIPESDVFRISPFIVAVNPSWAGAINQWVANEGQTWYQRWFAKDYRASRVVIGSAETNRIWCLHRGDIEAKPNTLAEQSQRLKTVVVGTKLSNDQPFSGNAQGIVSAFVVGRTSYHPTDPAIIPESLNITGVQRQFAGVAIGGNVSVNVAMRPDGASAVPSYETGSYIIGATLTSYGMPADSLMNMILIEGPSSFDYGEVSPWYEYVLVTNATLKTDLQQAIAREPTLKTSQDIGKLDDDPTGGLGYFRPYIKTSFNPFDLMPQFRSFAEDIFASNESVGTTPMSTIRSNWESKEMFVGAFTGDASVKTSLPTAVDVGTVSDFVGAGYTSALITIRQSSVVMFEGTIDGVTHPAVTVGSDDAVLLAKRLAIQGCNCEVTHNLAGGPLGDAIAVAALTAEIFSAVNSDTAVWAAQNALRDGNVYDQAGTAALVGAMGVMSKEQRLVASMLVVPGTVYDNTTAALVN